MDKRLQVEMEERRPERHAQLNVLHRSSGSVPRTSTARRSVCRGISTGYTHDTDRNTGLGDSRITARITPSAIASTIE